MVVERKVGVLVA